MEPLDLARATSPRGEVLLRRRFDGVLELRVNGVFVMDTAETSSERALATCALAACDRPSRVLVGGLGLGFTAREVLADRRVEAMVVVELESALVGWLYDGTVPDGPSLLADPRLRVVAGDVADVVRASAPSSYDLVLLDVDNGPRYLVHPGNAGVYQTEFLRSCREILRPGGVLAIWAANDAPELAERMAAVLGDGERRAYPVRLQEREEEYFLYVART